MINLDHIQDEPSMKTVAFEMFCKLLGITVGGGGIIAVIQTSELKDWVSISLGCVTGLCLLFTTFYPVIKKKRDRKRRY